MRQRQSFEGTGYEAVRSRAIEFEYWLFRQYMLRVNYLVNEREQRLLKIPENQTVDVFNQTKRAHVAHIVTIEHESVAHWHRH